MSVTVTVTTDQFRRVMATFPSLVDDYSRAVGNRLRKLLPGLISSSLGRYQTGALASSAVAYTSIAGVTVTVGTGLPQTEYVFGGVEPHMMDQAAAGKSWPMQWSHAGGSGVSMRHMHPGQPSREDILEEIRALVLQVLVEEFVIFELVGA